MEAALDHIVLNVADTDRALRFYTEVIGLKAERAEEFGKGEVPFPSVRVSAETVIDLLLWQEAGGQSANMDHLCLAVAQSEWQALQQRLAAARLLPGKGPTPLWGARGRGMGIYVRDPDGNRVELRYYEQDP